MARVEIGAQAWGWIVDTSGDAQIGAAVIIQNLDGTPATVYSALTGGSILSPVVTGTDGTISGFIEEGQYLMTAHGVTRHVEAVSGRLSSVEFRLGPIELDIRSYTGFDFTGGSNMATMMATAGTTAAAIAASTGRPVIIGGFRNGIVRTDSTLRFYDRVKWRLDEARIVAGADLGPTGMFRTFETLTPDTVIGIGTTTNGSYLVKTVANIASWAKEDRVVATGVTTGTKVLAVDIANSTLVLDAPATASATVTLSRGATYYYSFRDCGLIGGTLDPNGKQVGAHVRAMFTERFVIEGTEALHNRKSTDDNWAFQVGGRDMLAKWPKVTGGTNVFQDGFHFVHGQRLRLEAADIESGDDAVVLGGEPTDTKLGPYPDPIRDITIGNCQVRSARGYGLSVYVAAGATGRDWEITNVSVESIVGSAGTLRNGGVRIVDNNDTAAGTSQIRGVNVKHMDLNVGSKAHDDATADNMSAMILFSVSDITVGSYRFGLVDGATAVTGLQGVFVNKCDNITLNRLINKWGPERGRYLLKGRSSTNLKVNGHKFTANGTVGPVYITGVGDLGISDGSFLSIPAGQTGITISSVDGGLLTTGYVSRNRFTGVGGSGVGMTAGATSMRRLLVENNDFTDVALAISTNPIGRLGQRTTTTATALSTDGTLAVATSGIFIGSDIILNIRTREWMQVNAIPDGTHIGVTRARRDSTAAAVANGDVLVVFRLITRGNRGMVNHDPIIARDQGPGQAGVHVLPPAGAVTSQAAGSNQGRIVRFKPPYDMIVTKVGFGVTVWTAGDTADPPISAAIYDANWARLGTSGSVTGLLNSIGNKTVALSSSVTLYAGQVYYVGLSTGSLGTSTVTLAGVSPASGVANTAFGSTAGDIQCDMKASTHPLPDPWVFGGASSAGFLTQVLEM